MLFADILCDVSESKAQSARNQNQGGFLRPLRPHSKRPVFDDPLTDKVKVTPLVSLFLSLRLVPIVTCSASVLRYLQ
jgi:hypothetical protein